MTVVDGFNFAIGMALGLGCLWVLAANVVNGYVFLRDWWEFWQTRRRVNSHRDGE